jgi:hypothetical protein
MSLFVAFWNKRLKYSLTVSDGPCNICKIDISRIRSSSVNRLKNASLNFWKLFVLSDFKVAYQTAASSANWNVITLVILSWGISY